MSLTSKTINGVVWSTASTIVRSVVSLLQVSILTRYLEKSDFGIVAICTLFIGFSQIFLDLGFSVGIIHKQDITPKQYSSLFWFNILCGLLITAVLCLFSPFVAEFYEEPSLTAILSCLSFTILFSSIGSQHRTVQQKLMRFKYISIIEISTSLLTLLVAILLVTNGFGIYSLVFSTLFNVLLANLLFLIIGLSKDRNISFHFALRDIYPFFKIGIFSVGSQILDYVSRELDILLISTTLGKDVLGTYSLCKKLVMAIYSAVTPILTKVLSPAIAVIQNDIAKVRKVYYDVVETISLVSFPVYFLIAIFSYGIIGFLYGKDYTDSALILSLLAIYYGYTSSGSPVGSLQTALGRTDAGFYWTIFRIVFTVIAIFIGSYWGIEGIVICLFISFIGVLPIFWRITISPLINGRFINYLMKSMKPFLFLLCYSIPFYVFLGNTSSIPVMVISSMVYLLIYCLITIMLFPKSYCVVFIKRLL